MMIVDSGKREWWFLGGKFREFKNDPVAQGYEVLRRHPAFPHITVTKSPKGWLETSLDLGRRDVPRATWLKLNKPTRIAFYRHYKRDLERLGFVHLVMVGKRRLSFDCTKSAKSLLRGLKFEMGESNVFGSQGRLGRIRIPADIIDAEYAFDENGTRRADWVNLDGVRISFERLEQYVSSQEPRISGGSRQEVSRDHILAALRTFLETNKIYLSYRAKRLEQTKGIQRKQRDPAVVALACIAWDRYLANKGKDDGSFRGFSKWLREGGYNIRLLGVPERQEWTDHLDSFRTMLSLSNLGSLAIR